MIPLSQPQPLLKKKRAGMPEIHVAIYALTARSPRAYKSVDDPSYKARCDGFVRHCALSHVRNTSTSGRCILARGQMA